MHARTGKHKCSFRKLPLEKVGQSARKVRFYPLQSFFFACCPVSEKFILIFYKTDIVE